MRRGLLDYMGEVLESTMSIGFMDIRRQSQITGLIEEVWSNISVHFSRKNIDNPDPSTASTRPVIVNVTLHMHGNVDIRNGDTVILKLPDVDAAYIIDAFRGVVGDPYTVSSRKRANLVMSQLGRDDIRDNITPLP